MTSSSQTVTLENIAKLINESSANLRADLSNQIRSEMDDLRSEMARIDRHVHAIETAPVPYGRQKAYHSATEVHSVSGSRLIRTGRF